MVVPSSTDQAGVSAEQLLTLRAQLYGSQIELLNTPRGEQRQLRKAVGEMDQHFFNLHAAFRSQQEAEPVVHSEVTKKKKKKIKITGGVKQSVKASSECTTQLDARMNEIASTDTSAKENTNSLEAIEVYSFSAYSLAVALSQSAPLDLICE